MEITFKEIVKLIHPDSNPDITDSSEKMTIVVRNRGNVKALWNLAVRWGLVSGVENVGVDVYTGKTTIILNTYGWDTGIREDYADRMRRQAERNQRIFESLRREELRKRREESARIRRQSFNKTPWEVPEEEKWWDKIF